MDKHKDNAFSISSKRERRRGKKYTPINKVEITDSTSRRNRKWGD